MAEFKINDLSPAVVAGSMQLETDIGGTQSNKITISDLTSYIVSFVPPSGGLIWNVITADDNIASGNGYITDSLGLITLTLPATIAVGSIFRIVSISAGGWQLAQNSGQFIRFGTQLTTTGAGGYIASTAIGDSIEVLCTVANTEFSVISSVGNLDIN